MGLTWGLQKLEFGFRPEEIAQAKATVNEAQANLNKVQDNYQRQSLLNKTHATPEATYIQAKLSYHQAQAALEKANAAYTLTTQGYRSEDIESQKATLYALQAQAQKLQIDINDTVLTAPVDGIILTRYKEPGSIASPGSPVLEMAKTDEFWVRAYVDESHLGDIRPNQTMLITTDSRSEPYEGRVGFISPVAEFTPKTIETQALRSDLVYRFRAIVTNPDNRLRQGMPVTLKVK